MLNSQPLAVLAIGLCALIGYFKLFTTWAPYDDEGYVLVTLQHYALGFKLYDDIFTQYGPAFYQLESVLRWCVPHELTSDGQRWKTLFFWLFTAIAGGCTLARLTRNVRFGIAGGLVLFVHLDRLALEPGHPQMWCALITSLLLCWLSQSPSSIKLGTYWLVSGALCGSLAMIKLNVGGLAFGGVIAGIVWTQLDRHSIVGRFVELLFTLLLLIGPWVLFGSVLGNPNAWLVPFVTCVSLLWVRKQCLNPMSVDADKNRAAFVSLLSLGAGAAVVASTSIAIALSQGVSLGGLRRGLVGQHGDFIRQFYHVAPLPTVAWLLALPLLYCLLADKFPSIPRPSQAGLNRGLDMVTICLGISCIGWLLLDCGSQLEHGLIPRGAAGMLAGVACLLAWRVLNFQNSVNTSVRSSVPSLVCVAVLAPLAAFPTPGTQMAVGTIGLWIVMGAIAFQTAKETKFGTGPSIVFVSSFAVVLMALMPAWLRWSQRESLGLTGAKSLRLNAEETHLYRGVVRAIQSSGAESIAFTWHNRNSFYGWSNLPPLSPQSPTFWPYLLSAQQQQRIAQDLTRFERIAVLDEAYRPAFLPPESHLQQFFLQSSTLESAVDPFGLRMVVREPAIAEICDRTDVVVE